VAFQREGWSLDVNRNDLQGYFDKTSPSECSKEIAENLCGELVVSRVVYCQNYKWHRRSIIEI